MTPQDESLTLSEAIDRIRAVDDEILEMVGGPSMPAREAFRNLLDQRRRLSRTIDELTDSLLALL
jgi:hypothetical protein